MLLRYGYFCTDTPIFYSRIMGCHENDEIIYDQRAFIFEDNIFLHLSGPNEQIYTHNNMSFVFKLGLINPLAYYSLPMFFPQFLYFINIHEYANEIFFI